MGVALAEIIGVAICNDSSLFETMKESEFLGELKNVGLSGVALERALELVHPPPPSEAAVESEKNDPCNDKGEALHFLARPSTTRKDILFRASVLEQLTWAKRTLSPPTACIFSFFSHPPPPPYHHIIPQQLPSTITHGIPFLTAFSLGKEISARIREDARAAAAPLMARAQQHHHATKATSVSLGVTGSASSDNELDLTYGETPFEALLWGFQTVEKVSFAFFAASKGRFSCQCEKRYKLRGALQASLYPLTQHKNTNAQRYLTKKISEALRRVA